MDGSGAGVVQFGEANYLDSERGRRNPGEILEG